MKKFKKIKRKVFKVVRVFFLPIKIICVFMENILFLLKYFPLRKKKKIIYALTPPPRLKNIGDHAQVIGIMLWLKKHFSSPFIEINKDEVVKLYYSLKIIVSSEDMFFLHSGGNLGDRGIWSESKRRFIIKKFKKNKIISLPQTIYFSDTLRGRAEREKSKKIYSLHPDLTVIARDYKSKEIAQKIFKNARIFSAPDFVLSLDYKKAKRNKENIKNDKTLSCLLCLRNDTESITDKEEIKNILQSVPLKLIYFDTTIKKSINKKERIKRLQETLFFFNKHDLIITDRYHGVIFSILTKKPCIVLPTIDHKIEAGMRWFKEINFIKLVLKTNQLPEAVNEILEEKNYNVPNWNKVYFSKMPKLLEINDF